MDLEAEVCPRCKNPRCFVILYWKGRQYTYRRDEYGYTLRVNTAKQKLFEIDKAIKDKRNAFDPEKFTDESARGRKFEHVFDTYIEKMEGKYREGKWSHEHYTHLLGYRRKYFSWFEGRDVKQIGLGTLDDFLETIKAKSKTQRNVLNALHAFFVWMKRHGKIDAMPDFPIIEGGDETRRKALRRDEQNAALSSIPEDHRPVIEFMMHTGLRHSEVVAMQVRSVDVQNRLVWIERVRDGTRYLPRVKNKGEKLPVPLNDTAYGITQNMVKGKFPMDFLFVNPQTKRPYTRWTLWNIWKTLSGTDVVLYEAARHSFCSQLVQKGVKGPIAQRLMRHKDRRSTDRYTHEWAEDLVEAVRQIDNVVPLKKSNEKATGQDKE
jgi:integrase